MTKIIIIGLLLWIMTSSCFSQLEISKHNQAIISNYYGDSKVWVPTDNEINEAINSIIQYLEKPADLNSYHAKQIIEIKKNLNKYKVQFVGIFLDDKKRILCNFFPEDDEFPNWQTDFVLVMDGGFWYWQIEYDLTSKECKNLQINGEA